MMKTLRTLLKNILARLASWAIRKHKMELIVILGVNGTEITKELSYYVLSSRYKVRRVTNKPWWDLSIPLSILGYKDKRRGFIGWIVLLLKSTLYLAFGPNNPSSIIINLNYLHKDTMKFWGKFIFPDILVLSSFNRMNSEVEQFINNTKSKGGQIIINEANEFSKTGNYLLIGKSDTCFVKSIDTKESIQLSYKGKSILVSKKSTTLMPAESIEFAVAVGVYRGIPLEETHEHIQEFDFPSLLSKIKVNLYKSEY